MVDIVYKINNASTEQSFCGFWFPVFEVKLELILFLKSTLLIFMCQILGKMVFVQLCSSWSQITHYAIIYCTEICHVGQYSSSINSYLSDLPMFYRMYIKIHSMDFYMDLFSLFSESVSTSGQIWQIIYCAYNGV